MPSYPVGGVYWKGNIFACPGQVSRQGSSALPNPVLCPLFIDKKGAFWYLETVDECLLALLDEMLHIVLIKTKATELVNVLDLRGPASTLRIMNMLRIRMGAAVLGAETEDANIVHGNRILERSN